MTKTETFQALIVRETEKAYLVKALYGGSPAWLPKSQVTAKIDDTEISMNLGLEKDGKPSRCRPAEVTAPDWLLDRTNLITTKEMAKKVIDFKQTWM